MAKVSALSVADGNALVEVRENNAKEIAAAIDRAIASALEEMGLAGERFAKKETPVDTGRLRASITHSIDMFDKAVYIGTNVEYAPYVEMGVSTWGSGPKKAPRNGYQMLSHAARDHGSYYRGILEKHLKNG